MSLLLIALSFLLAEAKAEPIPVGLEDVVQKVSTENLNVLENAQRVYQAKEAITVARRNLLPHLNVWQIVGLAVDPMSAVGMIEDIAPFLVPANWFRVEEEKLFYEAQKLAYRALWANELMTAKALYAHALMDQALLHHIEQGESELLSVLDIVRAREQMGAVREGTSKEIEIRMLALQEDRRSLRAINRDERSLLAIMMGMKGDSEISLEALDLPDFENLKPIAYEQVEGLAMSASPEVQQFGYFLQIADKVKKERVYSFLGSSSLSRGIMGGVFDELPSQDGLGFGLMPSIRIVKSQKAILELQKRGVEETVRRHLKLLVDNYNQDLEIYRNLKRRVQLAKELNERLYERMLLGDAVEARELIEASRNHIEAEIALFSIQFRFVSTEDKLARMIFSGDYAAAPKP